VWAPNNYYVYFDVNQPVESLSIVSPAGNMTNQGFTFDVDQNLSPVAFTLTGYSFSGWVTQAGITSGSMDIVNLLITNTATIISGTTLLPSSVYNLTSVSGSTVTLYAIWTPNAFTASEVQKSLATGAPTPTQPLVFGQPLPNNDPAYDGYGSVTWGSDGNFTLVPNTYTITFSATEAQYTVTAIEGPEPATKLVTYAGAYGELANVTLAGYTFNIEDGWYTDVSGTGILITSGSIVLITQSTMLYPKWTANTYVISFNTNTPAGASTDTELSFANKSVSFAALYGELANVTLPGYTFTGWFDAPSGGTPVTSETRYLTASGITLYAQWDKNLYEVGFDVNQPVESLSIVSQAGAMPNQGFTFDVDQNLSPVAFTLTGYSFSGWVTEAGITSGSVGSRLLITDAATIVSAGAFDASNVYNLTSVSGSTVTLYAIWTANTYQVTFNANTPSGASTDTELSFASKLVSFAGLYGELANVTLPGYTFLGWFDAPEEGTLVTSETQYSTASGITLFARWDENLYEVAFDVNQPEESLSIVSSAGTMPNQGFTFDVDQNLSPVAFTLTGYNFLGWVTQSGITSGSVDLVNKLITDSASIISGSSQLPSNVYNLTSVSGATVTLYAVWEAKIVTFSYINANGDTVEGEQTFGSNPDNDTYDGYNFDGWNSDGTPNFTPNKYTITFSAMEAGFTVSAIEGPSPFVTKLVTYGEIYGDLANVTLAGYTFDGWFISPDEGTTLVTEITSGSMVLITQSTILYPKWTAETYVVSFNANTPSSIYNLTLTGPSFSVTNVSFAAQYGSLPEIELQGYNFLGWNTKADGTGDMIGTTSQVAITEDTTLHAIWEGITHNIVFTNDPGAGGSFTTTSTSIATNAQAKTDDTVQINISVTSGYTITAITVTFVDNTIGGPLHIDSGVTLVSGTTYSFIMPPSGVTIKVDYSLE
jgi:uncharacterized repeat protein (TIGR02543 family)